MMKNQLSDAVFKPTQSKPETKADTTQKVARAIIDAEANAREAKTLKLREARLKWIAEQPEVVVTPKVRKTAAKPRVAKAK